MNDILNPEQICGGDYVEQSLGLIYGIALGAGITASGGLLAAAIGAGAVFLIADEML